MKTAEIRSKFLKFFESRGHTIVKSSSLVPANDPTLLFTNSGMVQFKDVFTGKDTRPYRRATTAQRSLRAGGKHNDLENVGYTARHHTFFEMLGNFSFGDYFKEDAIKFAWELLTTVYMLPKEKLWVTVYFEDDEAYGIWKDQVGVPPERIIRIGDNKGARYASDNFWQMADTGPCGPCSEIFYDHGPDVWGGPPGSPEEDGDRYIEIWNLVFMQFDRDKDGVLHPLPHPCVDTGMGLERISAVLQHVHSNYEIDLFQNLIKASARETGTTDLSNNSLKVIADHIRACSFMIVDGVIPGNEGRGYVLRRIIRRALRHGYKLGQTKPFFHKLVADLVKEMGEAYPELVEQQERVAAVLKLEEERFQTTLEKGMKILEADLEGLKKGDVLDGQTVFTLYDTYGFPFDLTADICRERGVEVDEKGFEAAMDRQREMARASGKFKMNQNLTYNGQNTDFQGYVTLETEATVLAIYHEGTEVQEAAEGQDVVIVLDQTPFYAESGGQVGDAGALTGFGNAVQVYDTQKITANVFGHYGTVSLGHIKVGDVVQAHVNVARRTSITRNHSATHLMHKALRQVLGSHVQQKGSLVDAEKTRFDFSHDAPVTPAQIAEVEAIVNAEILANTEVQAQMMAFDDAVAGGAMALFGEKYGDVVRVLDIGFSRELCGGVHVKRTGDIGLFKIVSEGGIASGIRRVEAVTGTNALNWLRNLNESVVQTAALFKAAPADLFERAKLAQEQTRQLEKELAQTKDKLASAMAAELVAQAQVVKGTKLLVTKLDGVDTKFLREIVPQLKDKLLSGVVVVATVVDGKVSVAVGVSADKTTAVKAGELVGFISEKVGGKGGGRPDMAMGGGTQPEALDAALAAVPAWVEGKL
ncbi:alanine--tRNA ligase [Pelistega europaea]|uniref:Alanine--tRNA ligase n=1 Tax=Pelistega europaea TaxID=106147 RepID=A0A7Y4LB53_9BURK|nr:alanine--tRNA ligase [Pelistega europaea]NOL50298.1 alanine--tRNA ligase [Pelistega europaea]